MKTQPLALISPAECGMLPVQVLNGLLIQPRQFRVYVALLSPLVVPFHPEEQHNGQNENGRARSQVKAVADVVIWTVEREECPG